MRFLKWKYGIETPPRNQSQEDGRHQERRRIDCQGQSRKLVDPATIVTCRRLLLPPRAPVATTPAPVPAAPAPVATAPQQQQIPLHLAPAAASALLTER